MRSILALSIALALGGCAIIITPDGASINGFDLSDGVAGNGNVITETRAVAAATELDTSGPVSVEVRVGAAPMLEVRGDSNLLPMIRTEMRGTTLKVWVEGSIRRTGDLQVTYVTPALNSIHSAGSGRVSVSGLNGGALNVDKSGSHGMRLAGKVGSLNLQMNGSGSVEARELDSGTTRAALHGSGRLDLGNLHGEALTLSLHASGSASATGDVKTLNTTVHGSGGAHLSGLSAQIADLSTHGSGDIAATVRQSVVASSHGSGHVTVYGNPSQRQTQGKHVQVLN